MLHERAVGLSDGCAEDIRRAGLEVVAETAQRLAGKPRAVGRRVLIVTKWEQSETKSLAAASLGLRKTESELQRGDLALIITPYMCKRVENRLMEVEDSPNTGPFPTGRITESPR